MMKIKHLYLPLFALLLFSCTPETGKFTIEGNLTNNNNQKIYLQKVTPDGLVMIDSSDIKNGFFSFKVNSINKEEQKLIEEPAFYRLSLAPENNVTILLKGGEKIEIKADAQNLVKSYSVAGSRDAQLIWELDRALASFIDTTDYLYSIYEVNIENEAVRMEIEEKYNKLIANHRLFLNNFIEKNQNSLASLVAFYQIYNKRKFFDEVEDLNLLKKIFYRLEKIYPENENVIYLQMRLSIIENELLQHKIKQNPM